MTKFMNETNCCNFKFVSISYLILIRIFCETAKVKIYQQMYVHAGRALKPRFAYKISGSVHIDSSDNLLVISVGTYCLQFNTLLKNYFSSK